MTYEAIERTTRVAEYLQRNAGNITYMESSDIYGDIAQVCKAYLAEHPADDSEPVTEERLFAYGLRPRGDRHPEAGKIMVSGCVMMAANGRFVHLFTKSEYVSIPNKLTMGEVRRLFEGLGLPPKPTE